MPSLITRIPEALLKLDSASFQLLVNQYLRLSDPSITTVSQNGSHAYKLKTTTGQPDAHFDLEDGQMLWAEHATTEKERKLVAKFKGDIDGCAEERDRLEINPTEIRELKLCHTQKLNLENQRELINYGKELDFKITFLGPGTLAADIQHKYPSLAEAFLGISIGTGQLHSLDNFIAYYDNNAKGIATSLANTFISRETEIEEMREKIAANKIVYVTGRSGVGKTRLVLETLRRLSEENKYPVFVLTDNDQHVYRDLQLWFDNINSGYLVVEDANRQLGNLKQVLTYLKTQKGKDLRVVLTVRNYVREDVDATLAEMDYVTQVVDPIEGESIRAIIKASRYAITNERKLSAIESLVKGNVRFALMVARLLKDKNLKEVPDSLLHLFDQYFNAYVKEMEELTTRPFLKTLGLLSIFHSFDLNKEQLPWLQTILDRFDLSYAEFSDCINILRRRELVEEKYRVVKLSEQELATYFFYLAFLKDRVLDFGTALDLHYGKVFTKLKEQTIGVAERFGKARVFQEIEADLLRYEASLTDEKAWNDYLSDFGRFRQRKLLQIVGDRIKQLSVAESPEYSTEIDNRSINHYGRSKEMQLLGPLFQAEFSIYKRALSLGLRLCQRQPDTFLDLIKHCKEGVLTPKDDLPADMARQRHLFSVLLQGISKENPLESIPNDEMGTAPSPLERAGGEASKGHTSSNLGTALFLQLAGYYLSFVSSVAEHHNATNDPEWPSDQPLLRERIWAQLYSLHGDYPEAIKTTIRMLAKGRYGKTTHAVMKFDLAWIVKFLLDCFHPESIGDTVFVQDLLLTFKSQKLERFIDPTALVTLRERFDTEAFRVLKDLGWRLFIYERDEKEKRIDSDQIRSNHRQLIKDKYYFTELEKAKEFTSYLAEFVAHNVFKSGGSETRYGLEDLLSINLSPFNEISRFLLKEWLSLDLNLGQPANRAIGQNLEATNYYLDLLAELPDKEQTPRFWFFSRFVANENITPRLKTMVAEAITQLPYSPIIEFKSLQNYADDEEQLLQWIKQMEVQISVAKRSLCLDPEELFAFLLPRDFTLAKVTYLTLQQSGDLFDHELKILAQILAKEPAFIVEFLDGEFGQKHAMQHTSRKRVVGKLWAIPGVDQYLGQCHDFLLIQLDFFLTGESPLKLLFNGADMVTKSLMFPVVFNFLKEVLETKEDNKKLQKLLEGINSDFQDKYEAALHFYLDVDPSLETFRSLIWTSNYMSGAISEDVNLEHRKAGMWSAVLEMLEKYSGKHDISEIKDYIQEQIASLEFSAREESKRIFARA